LQAQISGTDESPTAGSFTYGSSGRPEPGTTLRSNAMSSSSAGARPVRP
jgi:hypothetical protein